MANLTRKNVSDIVRAKIGELDYQKLVQGIVDLDISLAQRKVQKDLMPILGMKTFTKEAVMYGYNPAVPTDLMMTNDSIIRIKAGIGVKGSATLTLSPLVADECKFTITALKAGSLWNYTLSLVDEQVTTAVSLTGTTISVAFDVSANTVTSTAIVNALNASTLVNSDFIFSTTTGNTKPVTTGSVTISNGANPTNYYNCREMTIEEYTDIPNNTYLAPSATAPQFVRRGDTTAIQHIEFIPNTINYSIIYYRYNIADLTTDSSTLSIPTEYEELVIQNTISRCYETLKANAESQAKQLEYAQKIKEYEQSYLDSRNAITMEKTRLQSSDTTN